MGSPYLPGLQAASQAFPNTGTGRSHASFGHPDGSLTRIMRFLNGRGCSLPAGSRAADRALLWKGFSVLAHGYPARDLTAETARCSTITQIYEGTNQIQRMVMARQLLKD